MPSPHHELGATLLAKRSVSVVGRVAGGASVQLGLLGLLAFGVSLLEVNAHQSLSLRAIGLELCVHLAKNGFGARSVLSVERREVAIIELADGVLLFDVFEGPKRAPLTLVELCWS
jgi:hypothetical protein